jgi:hypothetical protein
MSNAFTPSPEKTATLDALSDIRNAIRTLRQNGCIGDKSNIDLLVALSQLNNAEKNVRQGR